MATHVFNQQRMLQTLQVIYSDLENFPLSNGETRSYAVGGWAKWKASSTTLTLMRNENRTLNVTSAKIIGVRISSYCFATLPDLADLLSSRFSKNNLLTWNTCSLHPEMPSLAMMPDEDACEQCSYQRIELEDVCPICLDDTRQCAIWVENTNCTHCFHANCMANVKPSLVNGTAQKQCPLCRAPFHAIVM